MHNAQGRTTVKIPAGQVSSTGGFEVTGSKIAGFAFPAGFTGTTVQFEGRTDEASTTWLPIHDNTGARLTYTVAADRIVVFDPAFLAGLRFVRFVCGTAQAADAIVTVFIGD